MAAAQATEDIEVDGIRLEVTMRGKGRDILFLSSGSWLADERPFIESLATLGRVVAPTHPGFGLSDAPARLTTVDDLAYLYLDLMDAMHLQNVLLVGASFGGWIAAEMAVKTDAKLAALALIAPFGVKAGARDERTIADVFSIPDREIAARSYADPQRFHREIRDYSEEDLTRRVRAREGLARFGWSPYMHDPKLPGRLHRVSVPTLVLRGAADRMLAESCTDLYTARLRSPRSATVPGAAHFPHLEAPQNVIEQLAALLAGTRANPSRLAQETV